MLNYCEKEGFTTRKEHALMLLGAILVFFGIIILIVASISPGGGGSIEGLILIGPIPILFGVGSKSGILIIISVIFCTISIILFILLKGWVRKV